MAGVCFEQVRHLDGPHFREVVELVVQALKREGFVVLSEIDARNTFRRHLGIEFRHYVILGTYNPNLAYRALGEDPQIGLLTPCNIVIQETVEDGIVVSVADPERLFELFGNPRLNGVSEEASKRLKRVMASLS